MIICCKNCKKQFKINSDLIPVKGRLLKCGACEYKWFFKKNVEPVITHQLDESRLKKNIENFTNKKTLINSFDSQDKTSDNTSIIKVNKRKTRLLNIIIIFLISFTALIILIDTFKYPINKVVPNIEFILYNLYESIKDIKLFFIDLI